MKAIRREPNLLRLTGPIGCGKSVAVTTFVAALDNDRYSPLVSCIRNAFAVDLE